MWIVELALRRPHTFVVLAITIALFGVLSVRRMAVDIFPSINIPIVSCAWTYMGMSPYYMENLITTVTERAFVSTISSMQRMESTSLSGMSIIKVFLHKGADMGADVAQVTSVCTAILRQLPRGITPPFVTASSATDVPVLQLGITSNTLSESELFDIANNLIRSQLATVQGAKVPFPYGGKFRQVTVDLDPAALFATGMSPGYVVQLLKDQNVIAPCGTAKMGTYEYIVNLNNMPDTIAQLNDIPLKKVNNAIVFLKDVATVHDGNMPQLNIVNINGRRGVLFNILKNGDASTLSVVQGVKAALPRIQSMVPPGCQIKILTDQSVFVAECVAEVAREALIAAGLTAVMMLALLGSWRSTVIVATSIPLAILAAIIGLNVFGQTINSMTLGGLALAIGMLVDDATVEVENVHRNMAMGKSMERAILDGAQQVALPAFVSTLSICIVFVPVLFLTEPARSLFVPLGMAVVFAMMASYGLSRTVVPLMAKRLLAAEHPAHPGGGTSPAGQGNQTPVPTSFPAGSHEHLSIFSRIHQFIDYAFESARTSYGHVLAWVLDHPRTGAACFLTFYALSLCLLPLVGEDFFPAIDGGQLRLHVNAKPGTRVEQTERLFRRIEKSIEKVVPREEIALITDNIGLPVSGINYALSDSQTVGESDGEILVTLKEDRKHATAYYQKSLRRMLAREYPEIGFYFQPADIVTQILNAGLPAPIDIKVAGFKRDENYKLALSIKRDVAKIEGTADVCLHQIVHAPHFLWEVDRTRAKELGVTQKDISESFNTSLTSSFQTNPNFWLNRTSNINYYLAVQTPQRSIASLDNLRVMPVTSANPKTSDKPPMLMNLAAPHRVATPTVVNHINVMPVYDVYAATQGKDLGTVARQVQKVLDAYKKKAPTGTFLVVAGQVLSMKMAYVMLLAGLVFAVILVYFLLVVNFQSWTDPLIILMAIPGAFSGILWSLFATQTTFSIPALMGTIMTIGVASANSILMITFAREQLAEGCDARTAALNAGYQRFRPVIMTATAMIIGMIPMAVAAGQGGSQNAPIGRAVIGGLIVATFSTLLFVPLIFSYFRRHQARKSRIGHVDS